MRLGIATFAALLLTQLMVSNALLAQCASCGHKPAADMLWADYEPPCHGCGIGHGCDPCCNKFPLLNLVGRGVKRAGQALTCIIPCGPRSGHGCGISCIGAGSGCCGCGVACRPALSHRHCEPACGSGCGCGIGGGRLLSGLIPRGTSGCCTAKLGCCDTCGDVASSHVYSHAEPIETLHAPTHIGPTPVPESPFKDDPATPADAPAVAPEKPKTSARPSLRPATRTPVRSASTQKFRIEPAEECEVTEDMAPAPRRAEYSVLKRTSAEVEVENDDPAPVATATRPVVRSKSAVPHNPLRAK